MHRAGGTLAAVVAIVTALLVGPAHATVPGRNGKIAYTDGGQFDIAVINPDGSGYQRLTTGPEFDVAPAWSPDGSRIAFVSNRGVSPGAPSDLWTMNADGTAPARVPTLPLCCPRDPAWSPDGQRLAFADESDIYVVNIDGTGLTRLTSDSTQEWDPAWSPDGSRIAYQNNRSGRFDIHLIDPDGTDEINLTNSPGIHDQSPTWSPDGSTIAYGSGTVTTSEVYSTPADGSGTPTQLSNGNNSYDPTWSPDGTKIAFASSRDGDGDEIYVMNADGSDENRITVDGGFPSDFDWQPLPLSDGRGYARPRGAGPVDLRFVPAYNACTSPSTGSVHGAPLAVPSCQPPQQSSLFLTMGTGDSNGEASQFVGGLTAKVICNPPAPTPSPPCKEPGDQADVRFDAQFVDVRTVPNLTDYLGELQVNVTLRMTDRHNGVTGSDPATAIDVPFFFAVPCSGDLDTTIGSTCSVSTTAEAVIPGMVPESTRSIWQFGQVQVFDGGADGVAATPDNTLFAVQGLFAP